MSKVLATDLDGTLIPLRDVPENTRDLSRLSEELDKHQVTLTFVTGRHMKSVLGAIQNFGLPTPDWVICDVGSTIYLRRKDSTFYVAESYADHLQEIVGEFSPQKVRESFANWTDLRLQEEEKQGRFKLSYYCDASKVRNLVRSLENSIGSQSMPYNVIGSVDPFNGDGLIDLLPTNVSKAFALKWWTSHAEMKEDEAVFAGDSGNDLAAMTAGYRTIVVGNADRDLAQEVREHFLSRNQLDRLYLAEKKATSGVLDGCRHFGLFP